MCSARKTSARFSIKLSALIGAAAAVVGALSAECESLLPAESASAHEFALGQVLLAR